MSKLLTIEIPDEIYSSVQIEAEGNGKTAEKFVLEIVVKKFSKPNGQLNDQEKQDALREILKYAGAVNSGNSRSADNEQIDADLAEEYGRGL